ncbi:primosomal protein DnaI [Bacillus alkalicellulosilyticus]|uniref:primosomal protein DnaI n=1 Tax=Alkalihalobacterium alkalicellulosilyticum TaxID=1912214 RepID=UPI0009971CE7|nr:primosomal protein DnaI [Bacillus alkalicellulosilyticus]
MESIKTALQDFLGNEKMKNQYELMKQELLHDYHVQTFLAKQNLSNEIIDRSISALQEYRRDLQHCNHCPGLQACPNLLKGYRPDMDVKPKHLEVFYVPCDKKRQDEEAKKQQSLIKSLYIPKEITEARFESFESDNPSRLEASHAAYEFARTVIPGETAQGLYLYGKFGVGKTFIMGAVANELKDRNIETMLVYTPDFFREIRSSLSDGTFNDKLDRVKKARVLILDDVGAETMSAWIRDEVLGVILQHRMLEKLPTLYTSNYALNELEEHLMYSDKGGYEELKAKRIMERIRHFTIPYFIEGRNRRS